MILSDAHLSLARARRLARQFCSLGLPASLTLDDVASAALEGLWRAGLTYDETKGPWSTWSKWRAWDAMKALASNFRRCPLDMYLDDLRWPLESGDQKETPAPTQQPDARAFWRDELRSALSALTRTERQVMVLRAAGFTSTEVGDILNKGASTVECHTSNARKAYDAAHPMDPRSQVADRRNLQSRYRGDLLPAGDPK